MRGILFALFSVIALSMLPRTSCAQLEPGEISSKLTADLDDDGGLEVIVVRKCKPPATFERVEIFRTHRNERPAFASEWKEIEEGLQFSARGQLKVERVASQVLVKYIRTEKNMRTGGGYESEHITYYSYIYGWFGLLFEYTAHNLDWHKGRFGHAGYLNDTVRIVSFKDIDGDGNTDILLLVKEKKIQEQGKDNKGISTWTTNITQKILRYDWKEQHGFVLVGEEEKNE